MLDQIVATYIQVFRYIHAPHLISCNSSNLTLLVLHLMFNSQHFTQPQVIEQLAYCLMAIGAVMFFLSFLGYCGAIRESQCLLTTVSLCSVSRIPHKNV